jgi:hypothetical protein
VLPGVFALSTADRISVDDGFEFLSENIAPWANSAQVILKRTPEDYEGFIGLVTFTFSFENQSPGTLSLPLNDGQVLGANLNCSESR